jgi:hypothetical protein
MKKVTLILEVEHEDGTKDRHQVGPHLVKSPNENWLKAWFSKSAEMLIPRIRTKKS